MSLENDILVSECSEDMCLVKNGSNLYLGDDGMKELLIICNHVHFSCKNECDTVVRLDGVEERTPCAALWRTGAEGQTGRQVRA